MAGTTEVTFGECCQHKAKGRFLSLTNRLTAFIQSSCWVMTSSIICAEVNGASPKCNDLGRYRSMVHNVIDHLGFEIETICEMKSGSTSSHYRQLIMQEGFETEKATKLLTILSETMSTRRFLNGKC